MCFVREDNTEVENIRSYPKAFEEKKAKKHSSRISNNFWGWSSYGRKSNPSRKKSENEVVK